MLLADQITQLTHALSESYSQPEAAALARRVVSYRLGLNYHDLLLRQRERLDEPTLLVLDDDLNRLLRREPVQYVLGTAPFLDLELEVGPGVLIPRPETEELVQLIVREQQAASTARIVDIGTGSGCIAVALSWYLPRAEVAGVDVSAEALTVARRNGQRYGENVTWLQADVFSPPEELFAAASLDVVVSNPPYVPWSEHAEMAPHVRDHEPALALFVPDDDPLRYYHRLALVGEHWLRPGGHLYLETHTHYASAVGEVLRQGPFAEVRVREDFTGRPRFVMATRR